MRYDLTVNALTFTALREKKIIIEGGKQIRPNIHIDDLTDLYIFLIKNKKIKNQIYNAGFENLSVEKIANVIKKKIKSKLIYKKKIDRRSYRINSDKLLKSGFKPKKNINIAIEELISLYKKKKLRNYPNFFSVKWLKRQLYKNAQL
jgi:nucleoside-diphosphate-sugar epimerase